jgi:N-acetylglutamate synthase-like GNAT family acetyltransferase
MGGDTVIIRDFEPQFAGDFFRLNEAWISRYFAMEPSDYTYLLHPQEQIINNGGHILFAEFQDQIAGCCALIHFGNGLYELSKMAVDPVAQGKQIGWLLGTAILEKAKAIGAKKIFLNSNTILEPAIHLYRKLGFTEVPLQSGLYKRSNIQMEILI